MIVSNTGSGSHPDVFSSDVNSAHAATALGASRRFATHLLEFCADAALKTKNSQEPFTWPLAAAYQHIVSHIDSLADATPRDIAICAIAYIESVSAIACISALVSGRELVFERDGMLNLNISPSKSIMYEYCVLEAKSPEINAHI